MREEYAAAGPDVDPEPRAARGDRTRGSSGSEQSLVLLNRRGFATAVFCRQCAGTLDCPNCSVSLVVHGEGASRRARCHYCNYSARVPTACPLCAGPYLEQAGFGTERVEAEVKARVPARASRGSIATRSAARARSTALLSRFRDGEIDVLVGTQMIAKGHDFPRVTLVGVVSADVGLGMADFRASERTFQLLTQVAGRAGRGEQPGEAIVQTLYPDHYSIQLACRQDYPAFFDREMQFRKAMRYPPLVSIDQHRRARADVHGGDGRCRRRSCSGCASARPARRTSRARAGAGAARQAARRISRAAADQGHEPQADAGGAAGGARRASRRCSAAPSSTSIRVERAVSDVSSTTRRLSTQSA